MQLKIQFKKEKVVGHWHGKAGWKCKRNKATVLIC